MEEMGDWATLPTDMLIKVVQRLVHMEDFISLGAVCKSWKSITSTFKKNLVLPPKFPLLMLPEDDQHPCRKRRRQFYSLSALKTYEIEFPEAMGRKCLGTFHGWLLTVDCDFNASLLRPFSRQQIALPRLFSFKDQSEYAIDLHSCVVKVAMSGNPLDENNPREDCVVVAIARDYPVLAFARIGDQVWTMYPRPPKGVYYDVVYYEGAFYAVDRDGVLFICDVSDNEIAPEVITAPIAPPRGWTQMYLVESSGDLLLVYRLHIRRRRRRRRSFSQNSLRCSEAGFLVYKFEDVRGIGGYPYRWTEVQNLRGRALFLGGDVSVSSCSSKRAKPDCIYFSEDDLEMYPGGWDTRVYNMKNNITEPLYYACQIRASSPPV